MKQISLFTHLYGYGIALCLGVEPSTLNVVFCGCLVRLVIGSFTAKKGWDVSTTNEQLWIIHIISMYIYIHTYNIYIYIQVVTYHWWASFSETAWISRDSANQNQGVMGHQPPHLNHSGSPLLVQTKGHPSGVAGDDRLNWSPNLCPTKGRLIKQMLLKLLTEPQSLFAKVLKKSFLRCFLRFHYKFNICIFEAHLTLPKKVHPGNGIWGLSLRILAQTSTWKTHHPGSLKPLQQNNNVAAVQISMNFQDLKPALFL